MMNAKKCCHPNSQNICFVQKKSATKLFKQQTVLPVSMCQKNEWKKYKIPIPSLEEQNRIVAILDKFDALVNDIAAGLPAEIKMRRQQYEYYRNKLLTFQERQDETV
jgi:type I restriction enzyme S subunit